jgi:hypothetical protein
LKIILEPLTGNVVISEADDIVCRTKQGRKLGALWGISWYGRCVTLYS